jgi:hypothetical protein
LGALHPSDDADPAMMQVRAYRSATRPPIVVSATKQSLLTGLQDCFANARHDGWSAKHGTAHSTSISDFQHFT